MGLSSHVLFSSLLSDLSPYLGSYAYSALYEGARKAARPEVSPKEFAILSLLDSILKKFEDDKTVEADKEALRKFLACNTSCGTFTSIDESQLTEIEAVAIGEFKKCFHDFWFTGSEYWLTPDAVCEGMGIGPGASIGVSGTSFYEKLGASPLTGTRKSLYSLFKRETSKYTLWSDAEKLRERFYGGFTEVVGNQLSFVPKSNKISRTICTEPLLNMLVQKGVGALMEQQLEAIFGISMEVQQQRNRALALVGSKEGRFGTIDLSSASDTISIGLLRQILPPYIFAWLMECRSPVVTLPNGESQVLQMVSSMGNAFTFPLQTILFTSIVKGVYRSLGLEWRPPRTSHLVGESREGNYGVFGDDIIVCRNAYDLTVKLLRRCGFTVNADKSFNKGPFRESCGSDFWSGYPVRGVYIESLKTKQDAYSAINRLNVWSANHGVELPCTIAYLIKGAGLAFVPVPPWEADVAGIKVPFWMVDPRERRYHSSSDPRKVNYGSIVYKRYEPKNRPVSMLNVGSRPMNGLKQFKGEVVFLDDSSGVPCTEKVRHNPSAILLSAVAGFLRDGNILHRQDVSFYTKRAAIAPCWDYYSTWSSELTKTGWHRWKSVGVWRNLGRSFASLHSHYFTWGGSPDPVWSLIRQRVTEANLSRNMGSNPTYPKLLGGIAP